MKEAEKRGLLNLRRTPEALAQLVTKQSRDAARRSSGILTKEELESRYHVRLERYIKDMLIEMHTLQRDGRHDGAAGGVHVLGSARGERGAGEGRGDQGRSAGRGRERGRRADRGAAVAARRRWPRSIEKAEHMHDDLEKCAKLLTSSGADAMAAVREACDALELVVADELWPLPKYREMLFPV